MGFDNLLLGFSIALSPTNLLFAFIGVSIAVVTDNGVFDGIGSVFIGLLLVVVAAILGVETKSLLIGEGASMTDVDAIKAAAVNGNDVERIIHMKTLYLGPDELLVAMKVAVRGTQSAAEVAAAINAVEQRVRAAVPIARSLYIEPDIFDPDRASAANAAVTAAPDATGGH